MSPPFGPNHSGPLGVLECVVYLLDSKFGCQRTGTSGVTEGSLFRWVCRRQARPTRVLVGAPCPEWWHHSISGILIKILTTDPLGVHVRSYR